MSDLRTQLEAALGPGFTIERELGGGGMSRVFLAQDVALGRPIVVKLLPPEMSGAMSAERFRREIQVAARLQHPHIVPLLSAGHAADLMYFTMPFVEGESLRTRLVRGELPVPEAVRVLRDVADALAYAHKHGLVHRDIKPENVLLSEGHAVVTDFGVAKALTTATSAGSGTSVGIAVGTPAYMSPEQASADPTTDHRADIYAFGVLAYELLVGEPPFRGRSAQELVASHMTQAPEPIAKRRPSVPEPLAALIMRCLEKRPADRPQSAAELMHVIDSALTPGGHVPGYVSSYGSVVRTPAAAWRRWAIAAAVLVAVLGAGWFWRARQAVATVDERVIAVLPFRVAGADPALAYLREGMIDLLAAKLTGTTRAADPRAALAAWRAAGGGAAVDIDAAAAKRVGAKLGARDVLLGDITGSGGNVVLRASLIPVAGGNAREATVEGQQDSIPVLVDRLAIQLLALRAGEDVKTLSGITRTSLAAIRDYLDGQALSRRGEYSKALDRFRSAVQADSNLAVAWMGILEMTGWVGGRSDSASVALTRLKGRMSPALQALVNARVGPRYPIVSTNAEQRRLSEKATEVAPDSPMAWQFLGEVYFHWGPLQGITDAHARATLALERALALDSSFTTALEHLPELYYARGDTASMRRIFASAAARNLTLLPASLYLADLVLGDKESGTKWRAAVRAHPEAHMMNLTFISTGRGLSMRPIDSAMVGLSSRLVTEREREGAAWGEAAIAFLRGQPKRSARILRSRPSLRSDRSVAEQSALNYVLADGDSVLAADARALMATRMATDSMGPYLLTWFSASVYDMARGNRETARRAITRLRAEPPARCWASYPTMCSDLALVLDAQLASAEKRPDARARLAEMDSMLLEGPINGGLLMQAGNLIAMRLWEESGDNARALAAARRRTIFFGAEPWAGTLLEAEGRLAEATGDRPGAIDAYRKFLTLYEDAEPALQPRVVAARRALVRLQPD